MRDGLPVTDPRTGRKVVVRKTVTEIYTMPPLVPDARNGENGRSGSISRNQEPRDGRDGRDGQIEYVVLDQDGHPQATYRSGFHLSIRELKIRQQNPDGRLEPNEQAVALIQFENTGGMPSPAGKIRFSLEGSGIELLERGEMDLPSLQPGEVLSEPIEVPFKVSPTGFPDVTNQHPIPSANANIVAELNIPSISRSLGRVSNHLEINSVVTVRQMEGLRRIRPGEAARFSFEVSNISSMALDADRVVQGILENVGQGLDRPVSGSDLVVVDENNKLVDFSEAYRLGLERLEAGESRQIELKIGVPNERTPGEAFRLVGATELRTGDETTRVQHAGFIVNIAKGFELNPDSRFLVVGADDSPEVEIIQRRIAELGYQADIFDLGLEGVLDILEIAAGEESLREALRGKSLVLASRESEAFDFVNYAELRRAIHDLGLRVLVVSDSETMQRELESLNSRESNETRSAEPAEDLDELEKRLRERALDSNGPGEAFEPHRSYTFGGPDEGDFRKELEKAERLARGLGDQAILMGQFQPVRDGGWFARRRYRLGRSPLMAALPPNSSQVLGIVSGENPDVQRRALLESLSFREVLDTFDRELSKPDSRERNERLETLAMIMGVELALDMQVLGEGQLFPDQLGAQSVTDTFLSHRFDAAAELGSDTNARQALAHALAVAWITADRVRNSTTRRRLESDIRNFASENFGNGSESFFSEIKFASKELWKRARRLKGPKATRAARYIVQSSDGVFIGSQHQAFESSLWTGNELLIAQDRLRSREADFVERDKEHSSERSRFLLPGGTGGCNRLYEGAKGQ